MAFLNLVYKLPLFAIYRSQVVVSQLSPLLFYFPIDCFHLHSIWSQFMSNILWIECRPVRHGRYKTLHPEFPISTLPLRKTTHMPATHWRQARITVATVTREVGVRS